MEVWDYERVRRYLLAMECAEEEREGLHRWVEWNVPRFLRTLELIPPGRPGERCLEVGALPFTCVRFRWRGARAVFDGLDDALA
jgi:hypothetical protein